jgi:hypothetical protein
MKATGTEAGPTSVGQASCLSDGLEAHPTKMTGWKPVQPKCTAKAPWEILCSTGPSLLKEERLQLVRDYRVFLCSLNGLCPEGARLWQRTSYLVCSVANEIGSPAGIGGRAGGASVALLQPSV